jgi:hypothetical protein
MDLIKSRMHQNRIFSTSNSTDLWIGFFVSAFYTVWKGIQRQDFKKCWKQLSLLFCYCIILYTRHAQKCSQSNVAVYAKGMDWWNYVEVKNGNIRHVTDKLHLTMDVRFEVLTAVNVKIQCSSMWYHAVWKMNSNGRNSLPSPLWSVETGGDTVSLKYW